MVKLPIIVMRVSLTLGEMTRSLVEHGVVGYPAPEGVTISEG